MPKTDISKLAQFLEKEVGSYGDDVLKEMQKSVTKVSNEAKKHIADLSPQRKNGTYKLAYIVKNASYSKKFIRRIGNTEYQLAHLLEDGHKVYTRARGRKYDPKALVQGPFKIKRRNPHGPNPKFPNAMTTSSYKMFEKTEEFASERLLEDVIARLKKIGKI